MSRHRDIRNLNIEDELDNDALSDGGEEPMTQEEEDQLYDALDQVREIIGSARTSGLSDKELKDCLWREYYDVQKAVDWALERQDRQRVAQGRKETDDSALEYWKSRNMGVNEDLSRVPKIILAQQQAKNLAEQEGAYEEQPYFTIEDSERAELLIARQYWTELSTITEKTEFTEQPEHMTVPSPDRQSQVLQTSRRSRGGADSSRTTSYGEELVDNSQTQRFFANILNERSPRQRPVSLESGFVPSIRTSSTIPTIPSSEDALPQEKPLPDRPPSTASKKSKLASLVNSRLSIAVSSLPGSSRDDGTSVSGSIKTFPALRPSPLSDIAPSTAINSVNSVSSATSRDAPSQGTEVSGITAQVQRAIQAALQLEAMDQDVTPPEKPKLTLAQPQSPSPAKGAPLRSIQSTRSSSQQSSILTLQNQRPTLEGVKSASARKAPISTITPRPHSPASSLAPAADVTNEPTSPAKSLSKLALLAQQKISASKAPKLPASKTEYLVPTANGATATTAITTSYQSLFTLTDPKRPAFIPKLDVTPLPSAIATQVQTKSKLAMKVRKNSEKPMVKTPPELEEPSANSLSPIFESVSHSRALPSAFASVLVPYDDSLLCEPSQRIKSERRSGGEGSGSGPPSHTRKRDVIVSSLTSPSTFTFDSPSPDDIVFNARRGTSLSQSKHIKPVNTSLLSSRS